jgi:catechol 2,3-dioxygenase
MVHHSVSESIYVHELDFNGIVVYGDRLPSEWIWNRNKIHLISDPLDVKDLLSQDETEI